MRTRSQTETKHLFWVAQFADKVDHRLVEYFRSKQIIAAKERTARTRDEMALVSDKKKRLGRHSDELRRLIRESLLNGTIWFRGNDRSPATTPPTSARWPRPPWVSCCRRSSTATRKARPA